MKSHLTIASKLRIAAWGPTVAAAIVVTVLLAAQGRVASVRSRLHDVQEVIDAASELGTLADGYILHPEERPRLQFLAQHAALLDHIETVAVQGAEQRALADRLAVSAATIKETFLRLVGLRDGRAAAADVTVLREAEQRLGSRIRIAALDLNSEARALQRVMEERMVVIQRRVTLGVVAVLSATVLPLAVLMIRMLSTLRASLRRLHEGTRLVAAGDLRHRIGLASGDEFADLAGAMDLMAERLSRTTMSRDEAERLVAERTLELDRRARQLSRLTSELTLAEQRERSRLAQVLHDHLQQLLVGARLQLQLVRPDAGSRDEERLGRALTFLAEAVAASRSLAHELNPPVLATGGLAAGLEWLAGWMEERHGLHVDLQLDPQVGDVREDVRVLLFQSVRELLFNAIKHAGVDHAQVVLLADGPDRVRVTVNDEGAGFRGEELWADESRPTSVSGYGLLSIRERLTTLGGRLEIETAPGDGARFTLVSPVAPARLRTERA